MIDGPAWCADAWVMHQIFRKLDFVPDDIFFDCHDTIDGGPNCALVSVRQGDVTFTVNLGHVETPPEKTQEIWASFVNDINRASDGELQAVWDSSELQKKLPRMELLLAMMRKGIVLGSLGPLERLSSLGVRE